MFYGRKIELKQLNQAYTSLRSELVVLYGRRRIGKSTLVSKFAKDKPGYFKFEAIESGDTKEQILYFKEQLMQIVDDSVLDDINFKSWHNIFSYFTDRVINRYKGNGKLIIFFDEIQWMAAGRTKLVSIIKFFWDNYWKDKNIMLILCGSVASFMVKRVINSKALYGRINKEILLSGLLPYEAKLLFKNKRSNEEIIKYFLIFGTIPKYLEEIDLNRSFNQNVNDMCFVKNSIMLKEIDRIFYSTFKEYQTYKQIVTSLSDAILSFKQLSKKLKIASGGGLKLYLDNLENAEFIKSYVPFDKKLTSKFKKYVLSDEYLNFYFKYMEPNIRIIKEGGSKQLFKKLSDPGFESWLGFSFERFCIKHSLYIASIMGFEEEVLAASPYFCRDDKTFQIDLIYRRSDKVITACEIKCHNRPINTAIIPEMEKKCSLLSIPRGHTLEKVLISLYGPEKSLKDTDYFNYYITLNDILNNPD